MLLSETELDIPGYKIEKLIAEGGMADVYLAIQKSLNRRVALKLLKKFDKPEQSDRFVNEGKIIASLYHSNIITIHDIGVVNEQHYISMEYLEGGDLETRIGHGIPPDAAVDLIATIGHCLELVHSKGIVHRDIKPANILFRKDDTPVLTDFGIAKQLNQDTSLTMDGTAMGSPDYLSPEQAACKSLDGRADIYSLGILFYEMITGEKPYKGDSYIEIVMAHISAPIPTLPKNLERYQVMFERMTAKDPEERFDSVTEMIAFIDKYIHPKKGNRIWAKIAGFFRNLSSQKPVVHNMAKTLQFPASDLPSDSSEVANSEHFSKPASRKSGGAMVFFRRTLIVTVTLVLVGGTVWQLGWVPEGVLSLRIAITEDKSVPSAEESATGLSTSETTQASLAEDLSTSSSAPVTKQVSLAEGPSTNNPAPEVEQDTLQERLFLLDSDDDEVEQYLLKAKTALSAYKLTVPEQDNAYFYYKKVLALAPKNKEARRGKVEIANRYAYLAEREIERYEYTKAKHYVNTGLRVQPGHRRLVVLKQRTNALKDVPKRIYNRIESIFE